MSDIESKIMGDPRAVEAPVLTPKSAARKPVFGGTPGPWAIRPERSHAHGRLIGANINADGSPTFDAEKNGGIWVAEAKGPECEANARLIAAAPDLLDALWELLDLLAPKDWDDFRAVIAARAAIAKAHGGEA